MQSGSKNYVKEFLNYEKKSPSDLIEIHNRPNYFHMIYNSKKNQKIVLYFHNDPLTMTGSRSVNDSASRFLTWLDRDRSMSHFSEIKRQ